MLKSLLESNIIDINIRDNRIPLVEYQDICFGDLFIYVVYIKTSGFRVDNGPMENFYNSIDINGNFCYFTPAALVNSIKKITLTIEE